MTIAHALRSLIPAPSGVQGLGFNVRVSGFRVHTGMEKKMETTVACRVAPNIAYSHCGMLCYILRVFNISGVEAFWNMEERFTPV